jgi:hypothetical protein
VDHAQKNVGIFGKRQNNRNPSQQTTKALIKFVDDKFGGKLGNLEWLDGWRDVERATNDGPAAAFAIF